MIQRTWLNNIYNNINNTITRYTNGGISSETIPTRSSIEASDINNLFSRIDSMKNDYYLSTKPSLFVNYASVNRGEKIVSLTKNNLDTMVTNFSTIVCKNSYSHNNGSKSNGRNSNGGNYNGSCPNGDDARRVSGSNRHIFCDSNGTCYLGTCSDGTCSQGTYNPNVSGVDISNTNTPKS